MVEGMVLLGTACLVTALGTGLWRLARGRADGRRRGVLRVSLLAAVGLPAVLVAAHRISNARTFQFFGGVVPRVETSERVVALTFDDGPVPGATDRILAALAAADVRATFFLNGEAIERHPEEARKIVRAGHEIGNHSWSHPRFIGRSLASVRDEVERTDRAIRTVTGYAGVIHFRPPFGKKLLVLPYYLWRTGRNSITWDVEPDSYAEVAASADAITAHVLERARPGSIILLHVMFPSRATSLEAVPGIIAGLKRKGYRFVTVRDLVTPGAASGELSNAAGSPP